MLKPASAHWTVMEAATAPRAMAMLLALLGAGLAGCSDAAEPDAAPPAEMPPPGNVVRSFACGPPPSQTSDERYAEVAAGGFDVALPSCDAVPDKPTNLRLLDAAHKAGLRVLVADGRMPTFQEWSPPLLFPNRQRPFTEADRSALDAIVADYGGHPALLGYYVGDEPLDDEVRYSGQVVRHLASRDPDHPGYVNLWPFSRDKFPDAASYRQYLDDYVAAADPAWLSYDRYSFRVSGDSEFFETLSIVRDAARDHGIPFWSILQSTPHDDYRQLTEAERRWEAMQALAYGSRGILYFTYWTPPPSRAHEWGEGSLTRDGRRTDLYDQVARIQRDVAAFGPYLANGHAVAAFHNPNGAVPRGGVAGAPGAAVTFPGPGDATVGVFRLPDGLTPARDYAFLASLDYRQPQVLEVDLHLGGARVQRLDPGTGAWQDLASAPQADGSLRVAVALDAGGGALLRLR
jgi:hypothetical protein